MSMTPRYSVRLFDGALGGLVDEPFLLDAGSAREAAQRAIAREDEVMPDGSVGHELVVGTLRIRPFVWLNFDGMPAGLIVVLDRSGGGAFLEPEEDEK